jgi:sigma-B regulation protein RsbU (phosphoserine phosphatase)
MKFLPYRYARRRLVAWELIPRSNLGRLVAFLAGVTLFLYLTQSILRLFGRNAPALDAWVGLLSVTVVALLVVLGVGWFRRQVMWPLRNRLVVTYVFIGVIPVILLVLMGLIAGYLFAGQFATFVASNDIQSELRTLEAENVALAGELERSLRRGPAALRQQIHTLRAAVAIAAPSRSVTVWFGEVPEVIHVPIENGQPLTLSAAARSADFRNLVFDSGGIHLRVVKTLTSQRESIHVISSEPLDTARLERLAQPLGEITLFFNTRGRAITGELADTSGAQQDASIDSRESAPSRGDPDQNITAGALPAATGPFDREVNFAALLPLVNWETGTIADAVLRVRTRPSVLYQRLFLVLGNFANRILDLLKFVAIFFAVIELIALIVGLRLTRTITASVADLYQATQRVERADFTYRIQPRGQDQIAALATSFNAMTASLERLMAEQKERQRLQNELEIAHEVQAQLFPKQIHQLRTLEVHGVCRPARIVSGDYYDFLPLGSERLGVAVGDISGKGISAALLMATLHSAVRAFELGRERRPAVAGLASRAIEIQSKAARNGYVSTADMLELLNQHLYHSTPPEKYATLFLGVFDGETRRLTYSNAGHLPPLLLSNDGSVRRLEDGGMVIGLFDGVTFEEGAVPLEVGEIFVAYSDGITEPENEFGEFGEDRLIQLIRANRNLPLARISEEVTQAVGDWIGGAEQPDDVTLVLARVR